MDLGIQGRQALVTGASRGIGRAVCEALLGEGVRVAAAARSTDDLASLREAAARFGTENLLTCEVDLEREEGPQKLIDEMVSSSFGNIDIIVHNVGGTLSINDPFCTLKDWRRVQRLNLEVAVELNSYFLPKMQERKWGRIVSVSSISGVENHGPIPYCAAKAALNAYTRSMGRLVSRDGIAMSAILPGAIFTEGGYWDTATRERPEHVQKYLSERMAIQRFGTLDEVSQMTVFLCSQYAGFCVGTIVSLDGGQGRVFFNS